MSQELKDNLSEKYLKTLLEIVEKSNKYEAEHLFDACAQHINYAVEKHKENSLIDVDTAEKLAISFKALKNHWSDISDQAQEYLKAAMYYFAISEDNEPDFESENGFDDDVQVLNACLIYAGLNEILVKK